MVPVTTKQTITSGTCVQPSTNVWDLISPKKNNTDPSIADPTTTLGRPCVRNMADMALKIVHDTSNMVIWNGFTGTQVLDKPI